LFENPNVATGRNTTTELSGRRDQCGGVTRWVTDAPPTRCRPPDDGGCRDIDNADVSNW
jgi:hypothetical protein